MREEVAWVVVCGMVCYTLLFFFRMVLMVEIVHTIRVLGRVYLKNKITRSTHSTELPGEFRQAPVPLVFDAAALASTFQNRSLEVSET